MASSLVHERLIDFYLDDPIAYLKNFASYGWDEESDQATEAFLLKYPEDYEPRLAHKIIEKPSKT